MVLQLVDPTLPEPLVAFIYGDNGSGKTHLAATLAVEEEKVLFINYDGNLSTLRKFSRETYDVTNGPTSWNDIKKMLRDPMIGKYKTIVLDNCTGLGRILLSELVASGERPGIQDYGLAAERMRAMLSNMKDLATSSDQNVIAIAHTRITTDSVTGAATGNPSLPGQVPALAASLFPELIFMYNQGDKYTAYFNKRTLFPAATRVLDGKPIVNPNLREIYKEVLAVRQRRNVKAVR